MSFENRHGAAAPTLYLPGDPRITAYNEKVWRLADISAGLPKHQRPTMMYLSAADYGALIAELRAQHEAPLAAAAPPYLIYGKNPEFRVINAGTDDAAEVNRLNRESPGAVDFEQRVRQFKQ